MLQVNVEHRPSEKIHSSQSCVAAAQKSRLARLEPIVLISRPQCLNSDSTALWWRLARKENSSARNLRQRRTADDLERLTFIQLGDIDDTAGLPPGSTYWTGYWSLLISIRPSAKIRTDICISFTTPCAVCLRADAKVHSIRSGAFRATRETSRMGRASGLCWQRSAAGQSLERASLFGGPPPGSRRFHRSRRRAENWQIAQVGEWSVLSQKVMTPNLRHPRTLR